MRFLLTCLFLLIFNHAALAATEDVFRRYQDRIVQVRILVAASGAKTGMGSGFVATPDGLIVTNYHVIADLVQQSGQYRGEILGADGKLGKLELIDFDAVHDLALLKSDLPQPRPFELHTGSLPIGMRVFSIGTPFDLGFTIVEGTYNGLLEQSLYEKIHFTGSINPGMSGGPAVLNNGRVVGVNVATAGNQVSFLVPAKYVRTLLSRAHGAKPLTPAEAQARLRDQLIANQAAYMTQIMNAPFMTSQLGQYQVPGRLAGFMKCWGDSQQLPENRFDQALQACSSEDDLYVSRTQTTGIVHFQHQWLAGKQLNRFRFFNLYQAQFNANYPGLRATQEDVTKFSCHTDFVKTNGVSFKTALCLRAYKRLPGLFDAVLKAATLNENHRGVQTTLVLAGVSAENATRFTKRYLGSFRWNP
ncbi:MAG: trypsin-like peptidase domain-containing protein [Burkholderiales bacterium]|nr:trypsin-like peptidase domain-containing protein [Burkholderiales bacterium]